MNKGAVLARSISFEIETNPAVYTPISSIKSYSVSYEKTDYDLSNLDSEGWMNHLTAQRGATITMEADIDENPETLEKDPGQLAVIQAGYETGTLATKNFRIVYKKTEEVISTFKATVNITNGGGGAVGEARQLGIELKVDGPYTANVAVLSILAVPQTLELTVSEISERITATFDPIYASNRALSFSTSDPTVAVVTDSGEVVGIALGTATITVTSDANGTATDTVTVTVS